MSKLRKAFNEYFYAWGDDDPKKEVWRYGKSISLEKWLGYDDQKYYRPRRQTAGGIIILGVSSLIGISAIGIKAKYDKRKADKKSLV